TVSLQNDPVTAQSFTVSFDGDNQGQLSIPLAGHTGNPDGDLLQFTTTNGRHGLVQAGSTAIYTPSAGFDGVDSFSFTADDGRGSTSTAQVTILAANLIKRSLASRDSFLPNAGLAGSKILAGSRWRSLGFPSIFAAGQAQGWTSLVTAGKKTYSGIF